MIIDHKQQNVPI